MKSIRIERYHQITGLQEIEEIYRDSSGKAQYQRQDGKGLIVEARIATPEEVALLVAQEVEERRMQARMDYLALTQLAGKSDEQIAAFIDAGVTDLASAKAAIRLLARAIGAMARAQR